MSQRDPPAPPIIDVLVLDGHWWHTLRVIQALAASRRWRLHVLAFAGQMDAPVHRSRHTASFRNLGEVASEANLVEGIAAMARGVGAQVILPLREETALMCIRHRARFETIARLPPLPDAATFASAVDKASLARDLSRHGIPLPRTWVHAEHDPLPTALPDLAFPLLVKPSRGEYGVGMKRAGENAELQRVVAGFGTGARFVAQEFVRGEDIDCSVLAEHGRILAWTIQEALMPADCEFAPASRIRFVNDEKALAVAQQVVGALGWSGIAHIDMRRDAATGEVLVLEINARYWGSLLGSVAAGVNFPDQACRAALGLPVGNARQRNIRFMTQGLGFRPFLRHLRNQPDGFGYSETNLPFILRDPVPVLLQELAARLKAARDSRAVR